MGNTRKEIAVLVQECWITAHNDYRTKYEVKAASGEMYRVVCLHRRSSRMQRAPMQKISEGDLIVLYSDRSTGAKWKIK